MIVKNEYKIKISEINKDNEATNKAILGYLEDTAGKHSSIVGCGILDVPKTNLTWLLLEWKLQVIKRPKYAEKIRVETWSKKSIKCYAYRDFKIFDEKENVIALATSKWVLIDAKKGKIVRIESDFHQKFDPEPEKSAFKNEEFSKIHIPEEYKNEIEYVVRRSDIDVNNHMHNLNYLELAYEILPKEIYDDCELDNVRITYKREVCLGETVKCKYSCIDEKHIIVVTDLNEKVLHAIIELKK